MVFLIIFLCVLGAALLVLVASFITYYLAFYSPHKGQNDIENLPQGEQFEENRELMIAAIKKLDAVPFERVEVTSFDGLKLVARMYRGEEGAPVDICLNGYRGNGIKDFSMGGAALIELKHNVIIVDQRATGESEGHTITFGIKERKDARTWCEKAVEIFGKDCDIVLFGVSMGATTALMALGDNLPENVICAIADCPFDSPSDIIKTVCRIRKYPVWLCYPLLKLGALVFGKFKLEQTSASEEVRKATRPALIIHGECDKFVYPEKSERIRVANPDKVTRITFPEAGHGLSFLYGKERYLTEAENFIEANRRHRKSIDNT